MNYEESLKNIQKHFKAFDKHNYLLKSYKETDSDYIYISDSWFFIRKNYNLKLVYRYFYNIELPIL